jgi:hypothetical protein
MKPRDILVWLIVVVVIGFVAFSCGNRNTTTAEERYQRAMTEWTAEKKAVLAHSDSVMSQVRRLEVEREQNKKAVEQKTGEVRRLTLVNQKQRQKNDSLLAHLGHTLPDTCASALELATSYRNEADTLKRIVAVLESRDTVRVADIQNLTLQKGALVTVNDSLLKLIRTVPVYKPYKVLGFIPLPSRKATFVLGTVAGLAAGIYVTR